MRVRLPPFPRNREALTASPNRTEMSAQSIVGSPTQLFEPLLDSREAAALLRMHHKTLERKARGGEVPGHQLG